MATAYASFANGGHRIQPYFIEQIYNYDNKLLFQANPQQACALCFNEQIDVLNKKSVEDYNKRLEEESNIVESDKEPITTEMQDAEDDGNAEQDKSVINLSIYDASPEADRLKAPAVQYLQASQAPRILKPRVAYEMADILRDVVQRGTAVRARALGRRDIGGKTGTTNEAKDAWFAGFHPTSATVVWMGFDQPSTLGRREYGGVAALPVWMDFMRAQLKNEPYQWVSVNNRAKSKKQQQRILELTDDGITSADDQDEYKSSTTKPVKTKTQQRKAPEPEPAELEESRSNNSNRNTTPQRRTNDSVPQNPLTVTPTERMPPMPE